MSKLLVDFFNQEHAENYDKRNRNLSPISKSLHFLIERILEGLPKQANILSVGSGTGAEILYLAEVFPEWTFVAVEPSSSMINVCRKKIQEAGLSNRCKFIHGFSHNLPAQQSFDAVLAILVGHFIKRIERLDFFKNLVDHLRDGGYLVNAEISFDMKSEEFPSILKNWESIQKLMGATPESLSALPKQLKDILTVLPPREVEGLIRKSGIKLPICFFQAFMVSGWYGIKKPA